MTNSEGTDLLTKIGETEDVGRSVFLTAGSGVAANRPLTGFSDGSPFTALNIDAQLPLDLEPPPFDYVRFGRYSEGSGLMYILGTDNQFYVMNISSIVDGTSTKYEEIGSFTPDFIGFGNFNLYSSENDVGETSNYFVMPLSSTELGLYDLENPVMPELISSIDFLEIFPNCPPSSPQLFGQYVAAPPSGMYLERYMYVGPGDFTCNELIVDNLDGEAASYGTYPIAIIEITDPANPTFAGYFSVPEHKGHTSIRIQFGSDFPGLTEHGTTAAMTMQAAGLIFYDFSNPLHPVALSELITYPTNADKALSVPYTGKLPSI